MNEELRAWLAATLNMTNEAIDALKPEQITTLQAAHAATIKPTSPAPITQPGPHPGLITAAELQAQREQYAAERSRLQSIEVIGRNYNNPQIQASGAQVDLVAHAIREGWDANRTELEAMRAARPQAPAVHATSRDSRATLDAVSAGLMLRAGVPLDHRFFATDSAREAGLPAWLTAGINDEVRQRAMNGGQEFRSMSLVDLCAEAVRLSGQEAPRNRQALLQAAFSSASLTVIFGTSISARALATFLGDPRYNARLDRSHHGRRF